MLGFRPIKGKVRATGQLRILMALLFIAFSGAAVADTTGTMIIDLHDGQPWAPNWDTSPWVASGNFMPGIDTWGWGGGFTVERIWFYHGGDYEESGEPYQIHFLFRDRSGQEETYELFTYLDRSTTCNYCWEELVIDWHCGLCGSDEIETFGVFIRPFGGSAGSGFAPMLWRDGYPNHTQLAALLSVYFPLRESDQALDRNGGERDPYSLLYYNSDHGLGEVMLGMEVSSDLITANESISFSAVKSLY